MGTQNAKFENKQLRTKEVIYINGDLNNNVSPDDGVSDEDQRLHGYDTTAPGCTLAGDKIQLEDPDKKELLVCHLVVKGLVKGIYSKFNASEENLIVYKI